MEFEVNRLLSPYLYNDILSSIKRTDFSAFTGKTVLITGASKPLGYYLACALLINNDLNSEGAKIIAVDSSDKLMEKFGKLTYRGDIDFVVTRDYSYLGGERADIVIHTEDITELEPFTASLNLLRFITSNRAKAAICVPCSVYGEVFNGRDTLGESDLFGYNDCTDPEKSHIQYNRMLITETLKLAREKGFDVKVPIIADVVSAFDCRYSELLRAAVLNKNIIAEQGDFHGGEMVRVTLDGQNHMVGALIDRFGKDISIIPLDEDHFRAHVDVITSPHFFGWVTSLGDGLRITGPDEVLAEMKSEPSNAVSGVLSTAASSLRKSSICLGNCCRMFSVRNWK